MADSVCDMLDVCQNSPFVDINPQILRLFHCQTLFLHATIEEYYLLIDVGQTQRKEKTERSAKELKKHK